MICSARNFPNILVESLKITNYPEYKLFIFYSSFKSFLKDFFYAWLSGTGLEVYSSMSSLILQLIEEVLLYTYFYYILRLQKANQNLISY